MQPNIYPDGIPSRTKRKRSYWFLLILVFLFLASGIGFSILYYLDQQPSKEYLAPYEGVTNPTIINGELSDHHVKINGGDVLLPMRLIQKVMDPYIFWDEQMQSVLITTEDKVLRLPNEQLEAFVNEEPFSLSIPVIKEEGEIFVPFRAVEKIYPYLVTYNPETNVTLIDSFGLPIQWGTVVAISEEDQSAKAIRQDTSIKAPIYNDLPIGAKVRIVGENNGWYQVISEQGVQGYMNKREVQLSEITIRENQVEKRAAAPWNPLGGKINLTWEHVVSKNPNVNNIPSLNGLNVISPTWFEIMDDEGNIQSKADLKYVEWAHQRGYQVWGLITNGFNPDRTSKFLADYNTRMKIIRQLVQYAHMYELDGINIDFENVHLEDKERLVQFIRELTPYLHEQNLVVSIDVTVKSSSENWSMFYDRKAIGEVVDYMAVMTYDEYWASSPVAGSVASLPWVEKGLLGILEEVPAHKVLLGVPFYTRLWKEAKDESGKIKVTQRAYSMTNIQKWMEERNVTPVFDEKTGQYYAEYYDASEEATYKIWLEDATSMQKRVELVKKYDLAGLASWRRGFETQDIWDVIVETLKTKP